MSKMQYFPFERNNYFLGKLLSARDFVAEQDYINHKRSFLNRLLFGGGVLCGLEIVQVGEQMISVETGAALDYFGREIVVHEAKTQKLSMLPGFTYDNEKPYVYLCIQYKEENAEPAHALASEEGAKNYNRCREGYELVLTNKEADVPKIYGRDWSGLENEASIIKAYFETDMLEKLQETENEEIYLAKIFYTGYKNTYAIDRVENVPFGQYIYSLPLQKALLRNKNGIEKDAEKQETLEDDFERFEKRLEDILRQNIKFSMAEPKITAGVCEIELGLKGRKNSVFFSEPILHGLGEGPVQIVVGQLGMQESRQIISYGNDELFEKQGGAEKLPQIETAVRLDATEGAFQIAVKLLASTDKSIIKIAWNASRQIGKDLDMFSRKSLKILPEVTSIKCREEFKFTCVAPSFAEEEVIWSVIEENGGEISDRGLYKAPSVAGIYEINAQAEDKQAKAFVIVQ